MHKQIRRCVLLFKWNIFVDLQDDCVDLHNRLEYIVDLQDDCADLHNRLEYIVDLQDDCADLHNHLVIGDDIRKKAGKALKVSKQSPLLVKQLSIHV
jgi:hypothetical protein